MVFTRAAARTLNRMPRNTEELIRGKLRQFADDPSALSNNVKALKGGDDRYRLRVGDWRVLFTIEADRIIVHEVGPRGSIYG
ncbi:type II toxin-antitoxin system RelE/ParE family toxin [Methylobacterium sp. Leaf123]|uniref:type II toxin-antitoxin system RelE family toxin n=1 Tax=Methylobacterium sp. Leaf123 TaxID=1736264 RepID=UPI00257122C0|nr:type II toxin-antitoxin system RelE/ParE family toxin [Methylobacterium sp. Leaf123]